MKQDNLHQESPFERYISKKITALAAEGNGWVISPNDEGFDPSSALYMPDFVAYLQATVPEKVEKMQSVYKANWENNLRMSLVKALVMHSQPQRGYTLPSKSTGPSRCCATVFRFPVQAR